MDSDTIIYMYIYTNDFTHCNVEVKVTVHNSLSCSRQLPVEFTVIHSR